MREPSGQYLSQHTTLRVGGPARRFLVAETETELVDVVRCADSGGDALLVLGGGSNLVTSDDGFGGTVVQVACRGIRRDGDLVTVAAGEPWDALVAEMVAAGRCGVEALSGVPGLVGATPIQNVGAYGQEVAETITTVRVLDRRTGQIHDLPNHACGFTYRSSALRGSDDHVVLAVTFALPCSAAGAPVRYPALAAQLGVRMGARVPPGEVRAAVLALRRARGMVLDETDHDTWSAGSFFTNPVLAPAEAADLPPGAPRWPGDAAHVKTSAAWLIERAGYPTGYGAGRARLSSKHPLAVTNRGGASADEVVALAREIRDGVRDRFGVTLVNEPVLVGVTL